MAACSIFEEDEVSVITNNGYKCGLVVESSEYVSSDEEEDSYSPEFVYQRVRKGLVRVAWHPDGQEDVVQEMSVQLVDRSLMPGDVVRRFIEGQDSQRGYVRNTGVMCHVQVLGKNKVIRNINSNHLEPLRYWDSEPGDVTLDSWVGKIEHINEEVTLKFPDNAMCQVCDDEFINELFRFEDINEKRPRDTEFCTNDYYPGQQFRGELGDLESAKWIKSTSQHSASTANKNMRKEVIITVDKVEAKNIAVHWLCRGYAKVENPLARMEPPPRMLSTVHLSRLKKLDCFEACSVQLGDKAFYTVKPSDLIEPLKLKGGQSALDIIMAPKDNEPHAEDAKVTPVSTESPDCGSKVTVPEENGKVTGAAPNNDIVPNGVVANGKEHAYQSDDAADDSDYDDDDDAGSDTGSTASARSNASNASSSSTKKKKGKGPGLQTKLLRKKKLRKTRTRRESGRNREMRAGDRVPVEIIYTFSIIEVMWQDGSVEKGIASTELYPIHHLDELEFFPGDFVVRNTDIGTTGDSYGVVESVDHLGRTCQVRWMKPYQVGKSNRPDESIVSEEMSVYDVKDHPDYKFRPGHVVVRVGGYEESHTEAAGQVFELKTDGRLLIQWADKTNTYCYPQELYLIGDELSDLGSELDSSSDESDEDSRGESDASTEASWETEEEEEVEKGDDDGLDIESDKKFELDMLLDTAKNTLQKLEDTFAQNVDITPCTIYCYREILSINRNCKELDRMLSSAYFAETKLVETIQTIKKELKREKAAKIARQVLELFESNCKHSGSDRAGAEKVEKGEEEGGETNKGERRKRKGTKDGGGRNLDTGDHTQGSPDGCDTRPVVTEPLVTSERAIDVSTNGIATVESGASEQGAGSVTSTTASGERSKELAATGGGQATKDGLLDPMAQIEAENALHAKDLCQEACRLLKEQIMHVHEDLEKKWHKLQAAGLLPRQDDEGIDDTLIPQDKLAAVEKLVANAAEATANAMAMLTPTKKPTVATSTPKTDPPPPEASPMVAAAGESEGTPAASLPGSEHACTTPVVPSAEKGAALREGLGLALSPQNMQTPDKQAWEPPTPQTPAEVRAKLEYNKDGFHMMDSVPQGHRFKSSEHHVTNPKTFFVALKKELKMLHASLPKGIFVKGFEDRMDLFSVMIHGPARTPYEDSLFFFDVQLSDDYPTAPPSVHYVSFCSDRLNPNLYEDGKVCVSLLGTWAGRGTEVWTSKSSLLQVLISIQGLILVPEPYYNEAGYEKQKGTQQGLENSRMYNEMAILKMVQSIMKMVIHPPLVFETEVMEYMSKRAFRLIRRLEHWLKVPATSSIKKSASSKSVSTTVGNCSASGISDTQQTSSLTLASASTDCACSSLIHKDSDTAPVLQLPSQGALPPTSGLPEFPLLPASRGFQITLLKTLEQLKGVLRSAGITEDACTTPAQ